MASTVSGIAPWEGVVLGYGGRYAAARHPSLWFRQRAVPVRRESFHIHIGLPRSYRRHDVHAGFGHQHSNREVPGEGLAQGLHLQVRLTQHIRACRYAHDHTRKSLHTSSLDRPLSLI